MQSTAYQLHILENLMMQHQFLVTYSLHFNDYWEIENDSFSGPNPPNTIGCHTILQLIAMKSHTETHFTRKGTHLQLDLRSKICPVVQSSDYRQPFTINIYIHDMLYLWSYGGCGKYFMRTHLMGDITNCTMVTVKIKGTACCLYNVYTVVTTSHGITAQSGQLYHSQGSYTTAGQLYHGRVQGVSVHSPPILQPYHGLQWNL